MTSAKARALRVSKRWDAIIVDEKVPLSMPRAKEIHRIVTEEFHKRIIIQFQKPRNA